MVDETEVKPILIVSPVEIAGTCVYVQIDNKKFYVCNVPNTTEVQ